MKFGLIYELQLPRPWDENSEHRMVQEALVEVEGADRRRPDHDHDFVWSVSAGEDGCHRAMRPASQCRSG